MSQIDQVVTVTVKKKNNNNNNNNNNRQQQQQNNNVYYDRLRVMLWLCIRYVSNTRPHVWGHKITSGIFFFYVWTNVWSNFEQISDQKFCDIFV